MTVLTPLKEKKKRGEKLATLTAYDYPTARLLDETGLVDLILVGDSLGMVVAGLPDTTGVTLEQMVYHTTIAARGVKDTLLAADLPYHTYDTPEQALQSARALLAAGAVAAKLEGGEEVAEIIAHLVAHQIPVVGHLGMLPQHILEEGRYKKKGKTEAERDYLLRSAKALEAAGAGAIVLESMVPEVAAEITRSVEIPTIGIGAGKDCDGQILVIHDVTGFFPWFTPPFVTPSADFAGDLKKAVQAYRDSL